MNCPNQIDRGDDNLAEFDPWPPHRHHHHSHHHKSIQSGVTYRAAVRIAVAVIIFLVFGDLVLFAMSLHPRYSTQVMYQADHVYDWHGAL